MNELHFHPKARIELVEAATYYESKRPGYGAKFESEFDAAVEFIIQFPEGGGLLSGYPPDCDIRAFHFKTFRHVLIVGKGDGHQIVYALAHHHRRPGYWKKRMP